MVYSFSFAHRKDWGSSQWAPQPRIENCKKLYCFLFIDSLTFLHIDVKDVVKMFGIHDNIKLNTKMIEADYDDQLEIYTVSFINLSTGEKFKKTCKILVGAPGGLDTPRKIDTPGIENFKGKILRSQYFDENYDLKVRHRFFKLYHH